MDYVEKTIKRHYIYRGSILSLRCDDAELIDGTPCKREIVEHSGGACVLYVKENKILFVRQYRYAYGESVLELPAGKLNAGEDPSLAATRELKEETGVEAEKLELLQVLYPSPGYTNEKIYIYQAFGNKQTGQCLDEGEYLDVEWIDACKVKAMLFSGQIKDAKTVVALQRFFMQ